MNINATVKSVTGKMIAIAYKSDQATNKFPRVTEARTPIALKNWEVEEWIDTLELRCAYKGQKWGLEQKGNTK